MLELEKVLNENGNWYEILSNQPYFLKIKNKGNYYIFCYDTFNSDFNQKIVQESRGIIFYKNNDKFIPVCVPMFKFFNYSSPNAAKIDWSSAKIQEKVDGSLIKLFYHNGWKWATNGMIDANDAPLSDTENLANFMDLIKKTKEYEIINENLDTLEKDVTYMFELISPYNSVVVPYKETKLIKLSERNNKTLQEYFCPLLDITNPKEYFFDKNLDTIVNIAKDLPYDEEGYVVVDKDFNRIKIKSPAYVASFFMKSNGIVNTRRIIELIKSGDKEEFLTYYPEYDTMIKDVEDKINKCEIEIENAIDFVSHNPFNNRKDLALYLQNKEPYIKSACFCFIDGNYKDNYFLSLPTQKILKFIK